MKDIKIFDAEFKFMEIVWCEEPIRSGDLVKLADKELGWKKSTTYTVIRRLVDRKILSNEDSIVTSLVKKGGSSKGRDRRVNRQGLWWFHKEFLL